MNVNGADEAGESVSAFIRPFLKRYFYDRWLLKEGTLGYDYNKPQAPDAKSVPGWFTDPGRVFKVWIRGHLVS